MGLYPGERAGYPAEGGAREHTFHGATERRGSRIYICLVPRGR